MAAAFIRYMRAHGNDAGPLQRPTTGGVITALLAGLAVLPLLWRTGALADLSRTLSISVAKPAVLQVLVLAAAGAIYGRIFGRAANDKRGGWLFGISYGFLLWTIGPITLLQWLLGRPVALGLAAVGLLAGHLLYGLALGALFPFTQKLLQRKLVGVSHPHRKKLKS
jgi:hypothetical protein